MQTFRVEHSDMEKMWVIISKMPGIIILKMYPALAPTG